MAPKYRFFYSAVKRFIWAGNEKVGQYFYLDGTSWNNGLVGAARFDKFSIINGLYSFEVPPTKVLGLLLDEAAQQKVLLALGLENIRAKPLKLTETIVSDILSLLKKNYAFNGDSAFLVKDEKILGFCEAMKDKGLIDESPLNPDMFYLKDKV